VVSEIERKNEIKLIAIGIGHDVSKYYKKAFTIDDVEKLGEIIVDNLTEILKNKPTTV
jgi:cobaltochelatase CobT